MLKLVLIYHLKCHPISSKLQLNLHFFYASGIKIKYFLALILDIIPTYLLLQPVQLFLRLNSFFI